MPDSSQPSNTDPPPRKPRSLYDGFEAYRYLTEADYRHLLNEAMVVPDTNVLLNLYRYTARTQDDLLSVLRSLGSRLWVPHQVVAEFWRNREATIIAANESTNTFLRSLRQQQEQVVTSLREWANRVALGEDARARYQQVIEAGFHTVAADIDAEQHTEHGKQHRDTNIDRVMRQLDDVLADRVGWPLEPDLHTAAVKESVRRINAGLPPGYKDKDKGENASGDYLVWEQMLLEAQGRDCDVLFVTGDVKEDWWRKERGQAVGPRPELVDELRERTGRCLYLLRPESLLRHAREVLRVDVDDESVHNAEQVQRQQADSEPPPDGTELLSLSPFQFEALVRQLFEAMGYEHTRSAAGREGFDFMLRDTRRAASGRVLVEAKRYKSVVPVETVRAFYGAIQAEKAERGILVTTSWFGPTSQDFVNRVGDIELIDGHSLLLLLREHLNLSLRLGPTDEPQAGGQDNPR